MPRWPEKPSPFASASAAAAAATSLGSFALHLRRSVPPSTLLLPTRHSLLRRRRKGEQVAFGRRNAVGVEAGG